MTAIFGRLAVCCLLIGTMVVSVLGYADVSEDPISENSKGYFGESVIGLAVKDQESFYRGYKLFIRIWREGSPYARNGSSCLECHNTPMPGGSGMAPSTLVQIDTHYPRGSRLEIVQKSAGRITSAYTVHRRAPPLFGIGYLEAPRWVTTGASVTDRQKDMLPGMKFGAYGAISELEEFVSLAFADELGVPTYAHCPRKRIDQPYASHCKAVVSRLMAQDVSNFIRFLAPPPIRREHEVSAGEALFLTWGCAGCHTPKETTASAKVPTLSNRTISAYTDTKSHLIGDEEIRTPPLWGLNSSGPPYMHDGSANSIDESIMEHGGEAEYSRQRYKSGSSEQRSALIDFLRSL